MENLEQDPGLKFILWPLRVILRYFFGRTHRSPVSKIKNVIGLGLAVALITLSLLSIDKGVTTIILLVLMAWAILALIRGGGLAGRSTNPAFNKWRSR